MSQTLAWFGTVAAMAILVALVARQRGWGIALPLIIVGAVVSSVPVGPSAPLHPEASLVFILAPLVFGESLGSSYVDLRTVRKPVLALAVGLVVFTTLAVGVIVATFTPVPVAMALALGAILAPTDAVAVGAVARKAGLPRRLVAVLEGESLVNDGTGLTLLRVAIVAAVAGGITLAETATTFALAVAGGVAVGLAFGWALAWIADHSRDTVASNSLVIVAPFGIYLVAEQVEGSGILAVVVAGLMLAQFQTANVEHTARLQSRMVWRHITFVLQSFAFFLVGMESVDLVGRLSNADGRHLLTLVAVVVLVLVAARMLFVFGMVVVQSRGLHRGRLRESILLGWSGTRGPVSGMAAFSLPLLTDAGTPLPYRDLLLATTFAVVVVTLLLSLTIAPLARRLRIRADDDSSWLPRVDIALADAALRRLESITEEATLRGEPLPDSVVGPIRSAIQQRIDGHGPSSAPGVSSASLRRGLERELVRAEQEELLRIREEEGLPDAVVTPVQHLLDRRALALDPGVGGH